MIVPLTGPQYEIEAGHYHATVTELGAGLRELSFRGQPVIAGYEPDELPPAGAAQRVRPWIAVPRAGSVRARSCAVPPKT